VNDRAIHLLRRWSTVLFALTAVWAVVAFVIPFELVLAVLGIFAFGAAGFGLRWYAEVLKDRAAAEQGQNELSDDEGDPAP